MQHQYFQSVQFLCPIILTLRLRMIKYTDEFDIMQFNYRSVLIHNDKIRMYVCDLFSEIQLRGTKGTNIIYSCQN